MQYGIFFGVFHTWNGHSTLASVMTSQSNLSHGNGIKRLGWGELGHETVFAGQDTNTGNDGMILHYLAKTALTSLAYSQMYFCFYY